MSSETQPEAGLLESIVKEILFKDARGHSLDLEVVLEFEGEVVVNEDELGEVNGKEWSGGCLLRKCFRTREVFQQSP